MGENEGLLLQQFERGVVVHILPDERAAMAVVGVFAAADIGDHIEFGRGFFKSLDGAADDAVRAHRLGAAGILVGGDAKKNHRRNAESANIAGLFGEMVGAQLEMPRHAGDRIFAIFAFDDEERENEILGRQRSLAHHRADGRVFAQAARAEQWSWGHWR